MKMSDYLKSLLPAFTKQRIIEDIEAARGELEDNTLEPLKQIKSAYGNYKWKSLWVKGFNDSFDKNVDIRYSGNCLNGMYAIMENVRENLDNIESLVEREFANEITSSIMTVLRANLLQYVEAMTFAVAYTRRALLAMLSVEIAEVNDSQSEGSMPTKAEFDYLNNMQESYFGVMSILSKDKKEVEEAFSEMPNVSVTPDSFEQTRASVGYAATDPLQFELIPIVLNPIFHIRIAIADWQVSRFKAAETEARMLEFRLMQMRLSVQGKKDTKLEQQIEYNQSRLNTLRYELAEMEKRYGTAG